jgi:dihydroxy-acid dehydratase
VADNVATVESEDADVILPLDAPLKPAAGLTVLSGNLFDNAVMKLSVISDEFRARYLSNPDSPEAFEGRAVVFDGPEDYHHRIDDPALAIDENSILIMRGAGPVGYPGGAEVVNMRPPAALIRAGVHALPCLGDGRQSGTSGSPSILNAAPEAAVGGGLALVRTGDRIRIDLINRTADMLVDEAELARRRAALAIDYVPEAQTPWQEIHRKLVGQFDTGAILEGAEKFQRIGQKFGVPRDSH